MYQQYQIFVALVKMDILIGIIGVLMVGLFLARDWEFWVDIAATVVTLIWAFLGWFGARTETKICIIIFMGYSGVEPLYVVGKIISLYVEDYQSNVIFSWLTPIIVVGAAAVINRFFVIVYGYYVYKNFGKGLSEVFQKEKPQESLLTIPILN